MRGAPLVAVTVLGLVAAACGGSAPPLARSSPAAGTLHPSPSDTTSASRSTTSASASLDSPSPAPATATAAPAATPTPAQTAPAETSGAAPAALPSPCDTADIGITTTTDMSDYQPGENVQVSVIVRNIGTRGCVFSAAGEFTIDSVPASSPSPSPSAQPSTVFVVHLECPQAGCPPLAPGQMSTYPIGWNQVDNQGNTQVPDGNYEARAAFSGFPVASAPFRIG